MRLCAEEWNALDHICLYEHITRNSVITALENITTCHLGMTYLTRLFMLMYYRDIAENQSESEAPEDSSRIQKILMKIEEISQTH